MQTTIFSQIGAIVEQSFDILKQASLNDRFIELQAIISSMIVVSIMYQGYLTLAGRQQDPIRELVWDIGRKMLILCFVLNVNGWLNLTIDTLNAIYEWAGGGSVFYAKLDELNNTFLVTIKQIWDSYNGFTEVLVGFFVCLVMIIAYVGVILIFAFSLIKVSISNTLLVIVLPLALLLFMYKSTKQMFQQWLQMFLSNIILLILLTCFIDFVCGNLATLYSQGNQQGSIFIQILFPVLISAILITIINAMQNLASNLAQVSLDSSTGLGQAMGQVGGGLGKSYKLAKGGTIGTLKAGKFAAHPLQKLKKAWDNI